MKKIKENPGLFLSILFIFLIKMCSLWIPFFWDGILYSRVAHFLIETNFSSIVPPESLDSGHPTLFAHYLAFIWTIFSPSLWVTHLSMIPFLLGLIWAWNQLGKHLLPKRYWLIFSIFIFAETTFLAQSTQISHELPILCFIFLSFWAVIKEKAIAQAIFMSILAMISIRAFCVLIPIFIFQISSLYAKDSLNLNNLVKKGVLFLPATILFFGWLLIHYSTQGWWITPPEYTYGQQQEILTIWGKLRNAGVFVWRYLDHGRIFLWSFLLVLGIAWRRKGNKLSSIPVAIWVPLVAFTISFLFLFIPFKNPIGHRYLLTGYLWGIVMVFWLLSKLSYKREKWMMGLLALLLMSGHFWIYPDSVSKGWDSTLGNLEYFGQKERMVSQMDKAGISREEVCSDFPNLSPLYITNLNGDRKPSFHSKYKQKIEECSWVYYSNAFNGFSDDELRDLKENWDIVIEEKGLLVYSRLYKKKN